MTIAHSGTFTFLFTDIEGSTKRWDAKPDAMRIALVHHDRLLRTVIENHRGHVFKTVGDAFCAAFLSPVDGVLAAMEIQRAIAAEDWSAIDGLRVRASLHMGLAEERDNDYFGPALNRVARILSLAYGEQTLISASVFEVIKERLHSLYPFRDLGNHRLKDLTQPEHIFQVAIPEGRQEFPALKSLDYRPNNLPAQATSFIGREAEIEAVRELLTRPTVKLVTLSGPGGIGKTRLSLQVAAELTEHFDDGVFFVALAGVEDPYLVAATIAQTLGVTERPNLSIDEVLLQYLQSKTLLLVLDNFEQVVEAAPFIAQLLQRAAHCKVLISSRSVLQVYGEHEFSLRELQSPNPNTFGSVEGLLEYEAVRLFMERAQAVRPSFSLDDHNAVAIATICQRLDGLPLALELAAARVKIFSPQAMLARLSHSLDLLSGGARTLPTRQQTLRGAIDWSYALLDTAEQDLFMVLSLFVSGFTFEAVETLLNALPLTQLDAFDGITSLVNKSLIRQVADTDEPRFSMLITLRDYAQEKLAQMPWAQVASEAHADYFATFAEQANEGLNGRDRMRWLSALETEHDNLRAALQWAIESQRLAMALRLCCNLPAFWEIRGHFTEGRNWLQDVLALQNADVQGYEWDEEAGVTNQFRAWIIAGNLAEWQGDYPMALDHYHTSLRMGQEQQDAVFEATALQNIASIEYRQGNYDHAVELYQQVLAVWRRLKDNPKIALILHHLGNVSYRRGQLEEAHQRYEESLSIRRQLRDHRGIAALLNNLGTLAQRQGDLEQAYTLLSESLELKRATGDRSSVALLLNNLGTVARRRGDYADAIHLYEESLALKRELGDKAGIAYSLNGLGNVHYAQGEWGEARQLFVQSLDITYEIGDKWGFATALTDVARTEGARGHLELALILLGAAEVIQSQIGVKRTPTEHQERLAWMEPLCQQAGARCPHLLEWGAGLMTMQIMSIVHTPSLLTSMPYPRE